MPNYEEYTKACAKELENYGIRLKKLDILEKALTHPTYAYEHQLATNNQRLEFVGDAIVGFIIAEYLFLTYPEKKEGELSQIKSILVSGETFAIAAREFKLYDYLLMGKGEKQRGGQFRDSVLADALEALIATIYLECGYGKVKEFIFTLLLPILGELLENGFKDYKTILQELLQKDFKKSVDYRILEETGPDHDKSFTSGIYWEDELIAIGRGKSKKEAERQGAKLAIDYFKEYIK